MKRIASLLLVFLPFPILAPLVSCNTSSPTPSPDENSKVSAVEASIKLGKTASTNPSLFVLICDRGPIKKSEGPEEYRIDAYDEDLGKVATRKMTGPGVQAALSPDGKYLVTLWYEREIMGQFLQVLSPATLLPLSAPTPMVKQSLVRVVADQSIFFPDPRTIAIEVWESKPSQLPSFSKAGTSILLFDIPTETASGGSPTPLVSREEITLPEEMKVLGFSDAENLFGLAVGRIHRFNLKTKQGAFVDINLGQNKESPRRNLAPLGWNISSDGLVLVLPPGMVWEVGLSPFQIKREARLPGYPVKGAVSRFASVIVNRGQPRVFMGEGTNYSANLSRVLEFSLNPATLVTTHDVRGALKVRATNRGIVFAEGDEKLLIDQRGGSKEIHLGHYEEVISLVSND